MGILETDNKLILEGLKMKTNLIRCSQEEEELINIIRGHGADIADAMYGILPKLNSVRTNLDSNYPGYNPNLIRSRYMKPKCIMCSHDEIEYIEILRLYDADIAEVIEKTLPKLIHPTDQPDNNCLVNSPNLICSKCGEPINIGLINKQDYKKSVLCRGCINGLKNRQKV